MSLQKPVDAIVAAWSTYKAVADGKTDLDAAATAKARQQLVEGAKYLLLEAQDPGTTAVEFGLQPMLTSAFSAAMEAGLVDALPVDGSAISAADLAMHTGVEEALVIRLMRILCTLGFVAQPTPAYYSHGRVSRVLTAAPPVRALLQSFWTQYYAPLATVPSFLRSTGWREPKTPQDSPFNRYTRTDKSFYEHMGEDKALRENFALAMSSAEVAAFDVAKYPFPDKFAHVPHGELALVDVAGGKGQLLRLLATTFPHWKARRMVQDRAEVLSSLQGCELGFETMAHNYYDEQPVKAHGFIFRWIFMDNTDEQCCQILRALKPGFRAGSTKLLLIENIIPAEGPTVVECGLDMVMMCQNPSKQRTAKEFTELLARESFEVTGIWKDGEVGQKALIEAVLR